MRIDALSIEDTTLNPLGRTEASFEALNSRIARLAISLGLPLDNDQHIHEILKTHGKADFTDPHQHRYWIELRGLLVLRYGMEKTAVTQLGTETLKQILLDAQSHMAEAGFKPGSDGIHIHQLFDKD